MIRPSVLVLATAMASPALYLSFIADELTVQNALIRFLIAVPIAAVMVAALRFVTSGYGSRTRPHLPLRRSTDRPADDSESASGSPATAGKK